MASSFIIKICGIRDLASLEASASAGASAIGFMAYAKSKRYISPDDVAALLKAAPQSPGLMKVGVFVNPSLDELKLYVKAGINVLQLHGAESPAFALEAQRLARVWKAFAPKTNLDVELMAQYPAEKLLIDAFSPQEHGGTGMRADWSVAAFAAASMPGRIILAGGLSPENVGEALRVVRPAGVDVSSGVENAPGVKSPALIRAFIAEAKKASAAL